MESHWRVQVWRDGDSVAELTGQMSMPECWGSDEGDGRVVQEAGRALLAFDGYGFGEASIFDPDED